MECPYCKKEIKIASVVKANLERYGGSAKARTQCCKKLVLVYPVTTFKYRETAQNGKDDWGE